MAHGPLVNVGGFPAAIHRQEMERTLHIGVGYSGGEDGYLGGSHLGRHREHEGPLLARGERVTVDFAYRRSAWEGDGVLSEVTLGVGDRLPRCAFVAAEKEYSYRLADAPSREAWLVWMERELQARSDYERGKVWDQDRDLAAAQPNPDALRELEEYKPWFGTGEHLPGWMEWTVDMDTDGLDEAHIQYWDHIYETWGAWADSLNGVLRGQLAQVSYLGSLRRAPERYHVVSGDGRAGVGREGEHTWQLLARDAQALGRVNRWLERLQIPYALTVRRVEERAFNDLLLVELTDRRNGTAVSPRDVGFGVSQVLPLVVAASETNQRILCVEQPELHLHPRMQAELADLFIECTRRLADGRPTGQFLIETHSEALMLRVQRRIRQGVLEPDDVSVLYVDPEGGTATTVRRLRLDRLGRFIDEWPGGFFEERLNETLLGFEN